MTTTTVPADPARVPLTRLAAGGVSPLVARILPRVEEPGPERVSVAAFQSAV